MWQWKIQEWRYGKKIGVVVRICEEVYDTDNKPPENGPLKDMCVEAGDTVEFAVTATDPDNDPISQSAASGVFGLTACRRNSQKKTRFRVCFKCFQMDNLP